MFRSINFGGLLLNICLVCLLPNPLDGFQTENKSKVSKCGALPNKCYVVLIDMLCNVLKYFTKLGIQEYSQIQYGPSWKKRKNLFTLTHPMGLEEEIEGREKKTKSLPM